MDDEDRPGKGPQKRTSPRHRPSSRVKHTRWPMSKGGGDAEARWWPWLWTGVTSVVRGRMLTEWGWGGLLARRWRKLMWRLVGCSCCWWWLLLLLWCPLTGWLWLRRWSFSRMCSCGSGPLLRDQWRGRTWLTGRKTAQPSGQLKSRWPL